MSPWAMSARQRSSAARSWPQSAAACSAERRGPAARARSVARARSTAPARWLSIVTITTRNGVASAAEMRFGIVQGLDGDRRAGPFVAAKRSVLRRALPRTKNGIFSSSCSASAVQPSQPARRRPGPRGGRGGRARGARGRRRRGTRSPRGTSPSRCSSRPIISGWTQRVEEDVRALEAHLRRVAGRKVLDVDRGRDDGAGDAQPLGDVPLHLRAEHQLGLQLRDPGLDLEIVVGDQRLDAVRRWRPRAPRARTRGCRCRGPTTAKPSSVGARRGRRRWRGWRRRRRRRACR